MLRDLSCTWRGHGHGLDARRRGVRDGDGDEMDGDGWRWMETDARHSAAGNCIFRYLFASQGLQNASLGSETVGGSLPDSVIRLWATNW